MPLTLTIAALILGAALLAKSADYLVRGASVLAFRVGVTPLVIGLTVVAFGTSLPELATSLQGGSTIAIGNTAGSNMMNLGLILGLTALFYPLCCQSQFLRFELPVMVAAGFLFFAVTLDNTVTRVEGIFFVLALMGYVVFSVKRGREVAPAEVLAGAEEYLPKAEVPLWRAWFSILGGLIGLTFGGRFLVYGAVNLAEMAGISERIIALTIVAGGTSLPELATCLVAARRGEPDIALGNIVGSNIFNIFGIIGVCATVGPIAVPAGSNHFDIPAVIILQVLCIPVMLSRKRIGRIEGGIFLFLYLLYLTGLFVMKT